jgi:hypothetical protein
MNGVVQACLVVVLALGLARAGYTQEEGDIQALMDKISDLQAQIDRLAEQVANTAVKTEETARMSEATVEMVEQMPVLEQTPSWAEATTVGGYGELHYNNLDSGSVIDFHRFVLFVNHEFNENIRFYSELEIEHALSGDGKPGEVEIEQAWIEADFGGNSTARGGLFLVPVGILNETHEPPTFYGVERNPIEKDIIPSTWWEAGAGLSGHGESGFSWDLALHSGLSVQTEGPDAFKIRNGRQKVAKATAEDGAITGRIRWTGMPGLEVAASLQYQGDVTQGELGISATMFESHIALQRGGFGLRALYARWDLDGEEAAATGRDDQQGYYLEPSYRFFDDRLGLFVRYSRWNNEAGLDTEDKKQVNAGINYWPHPNVVLKADYQNQSGRIDDDGFNLGMGYQF